MSSELQWIVGADKAAVKRPQSRVFSLWPRPSEMGRVPMGLHMAVGRPNDELYSNPTSTRALVSLALPAVAIPGWAAAILVLLCVTAVSLGVHQHPLSWTGLPAGFIVTWRNLASVFAAAALGYGAAALWEAGICRAELEEARGSFGIGAKGPTVEPVVWRLGMSAASAWLCLLGPLSWSLAVLAWGAPRPAIASGLAMGSLLYLLRVCLPLRPGPGTRILEGLRRVPHFSTALRWALTDHFLPASQRSPSAGPKALVLGALLLTAWAAIAGTTLLLLALSEGAEGTAAKTFATVASEPAVAGASREVAAASNFFVAEDAPLTAWRVAMSVLSAGILLWLVESVVRLFRYAILLRGRIEREPVSPSGATTGLWARRSALMKHVPAMAKLDWEWTRATAGNLLVRQGDRDRTFHWLASGEAKIVSRDSEGNLRKLATLSGGSGIGELALLEDRPRSADVVVTQSALIISLAFEDFDEELAAGDRELFRNVVFAGRSFAQSPVFRGCPAPDKERWIRGGAQRLYAAGDTIIEQGESGRWMGLVVEGTIEVFQADLRVGELESGDVFGETSFLYETTRNVSLIAKSAVLLWCWESTWLEEEVVRTGLRSDLEALAAERDRT